MTLDGITVGLVGTARLIVAAEHTAARVGSGAIAVLATPVMINLVEAAALAAAEHLLPAGHQTLGTHLDVSHTAATPIGGPAHTPGVVPSSSTFGEFTVSVNVAALATGATHGLTATNPDAAIDVATMPATNRRTRLPAMFPPLLHLKTACAVTPEGERNRRPRDVANRTLCAH